MNYPKFRELFDEFTKACEGFNKVVLDEGYSPTDLDAKLLGWVWYFTNIFERMEEGAFYDQN